MSNEVLKSSRGEGDDPRTALKAHIQAQMAAALEQKKDELELTQAPWPNEWEVFAWGPYQLPGGVFDPLNPAPGRIIFTGEKAYIGVAVWMNPQMCADIVNHEDKIELTFWTSNTQTMQPVPGSYTCCIKTDQLGDCYYVTVWEFTPQEEACVYETNICARICNCQNHTLPRYAGFVRHVYDFDPEKLWPAFPGFPLTPGSPTPGWGFDRPIRYMVADRLHDCDCTEECGPAEPTHPTPPTA
jgi:hypothetical protein